MNIWGILVYLLLVLLGIGLIILAFFVWALVYVSMDDEEMERERMRQHPIPTLQSLSPPTMRDAEICEYSDKEESP